MKELNIEDFVIYSVDDKTKEIALDFAKKRRDYHRSYNTKRHWDDPSKGEYQDEYWGVLGEILFRIHIRKHNLGSISKFPPLFTENHASRPKHDAIIDGKTVEIKSIPPDSDGKERIRLMIKESEFHNDDYFVAIKFWNDDQYSFCGFLKLDEVLNTPIVDLTYSRGYVFYLAELPHKMTMNFYKI